MFFSVFHNFDFSGCYGGKRGGKTVPNDKKFCPSRFIYQELYIIWLSFIVNLCRMIISPGVFFLFSKILIFWVVREAKGQKMVQNDKKLCLLRSISQEPYLMWLSFMVHMCKMIIPPGVFFIFSKFWFFGLSWKEKGKKQSRITKNSVRHTLHISGTIHHMIFIYGTHL